jgi:hypothetical protein
MWAPNTTDWGEGHVTQPTKQFGRRRTLLVAVLALAALTAFSVVAAGYAAPNSAARSAAAQYNNKPTTGTKISIFGGPATFAADTPFYIEHGFDCTRPDVSGCTNAQTHFDLYLDGVLQPSTVDIDNLGDSLLKSNLTNYPTGLPAGTHTFIGVFVFDGTVLGTLTRTIVFT